MKALLHTEPYVFKFMDVPEPEVGPNDVLVRVRAVGICGSDVHGFSGLSGRRIPPIIMGHEASGTVAKVGPVVQGIKPGDSVCFDSTVYCNECDVCRKGQHNRCANRMVLGVSIPGMKRNGAMAEYVVLPSWTIIPMPESLSFVQAAMLEPVSIGVHAVNQSEINGGETVLIIGTGTIGLFVLQAAKLKGAGKILVSDLSEARLALARDLGADVTIQPGKEDLLQRVAEETAGSGVDVCFEVVGFAQTLQQAISAAKMGGRVVLVGNLTRNIPLNVQEIISRELTLRGSYASSGEYRECVDLVASGLIDVMPLVSEIRPLSDGQQCFNRLHEGNSDLIKIVLEP